MFFLCEAEGRRPPSVPRSRFSVMNDESAQHFLAAWKRSQEHSNPPHDPLRSRRFYLLLMTALGALSSTTSALAKPTNNSGAAYARECEAEGVPLPPPW